MMINRMQLYHPSQKMKDNPEMDRKISLSFHLASDLVVFKLIKIPIKEFLIIRP